MAIKLDVRYPGRASPADSNYPQGSFKNRTAPGVLDGSYLEKDWANDFFAYLQAIMLKAGIVANGTVDTATVSQYYDALKSITTTPVWNNLIDYTAPFMVFGSDGKLYIALLSSGPSTSPRDPISQPTYWMDLRLLVGTPQASIQGSFKNLKGSATGASALVSYTIDEVITGDATGNYQSTRGWNSTINTTTLGIGGLDIGTVAASKWYYSYAITKNDGTKGVVASLSSTSPSLPATYTKWARIGSFFTDSTANKYPFGFTQLDGVIQYKVATGSNVPAVKQMASGAPANLAAGAIGVGAFVPPTAREIIAQIFGGLLSGQVGFVAPNTSYAAQEALLFISSSTTTAQSTLSTARFVLEGSNIYYSATNTVTVRCVGYVENF